MLSLVEAFIGFFSRIKGKDATPSTCAVTNDGHEHLIKPEQKLFSLPLA